MDNILINLDDGINLTPTILPSVNEQPTILMPSEVNNIPGPAGPPGKDGQDGQAATITVGSTTTGNPGTNASVINSGSSSAAILDFVIPRGATGANGEAATISVGTTTTGAPGSNASVINSGDEQDAVLEFTIPTGAAGPAATVTVGSVQTVAPEYPATVTNSGTSSAAVLDFEIPQGIAGTPGQDGAPGQAATITVGTTTTGAAGTNASVTNSGTSSAAVFNFTIPRGDTGAAGQNGTDGADGFSPTATVTQNTGSATISITDKNGTTTATVYDGVTPDTSVTSYSLTNLPAHSGGTNGYVLRKQLNIVCLDIDVIWLNSISANSWTSIGTLPAACYPSASICTTVVLTNGSNGQVVGYGKMNLQTNGNVRVSLATGLSSLCAISGAITYII